MKNNMTENKIISLYEHFKDTPKPLKIICDWDEVIQSAIPYSHYLAMLEEAEKDRPFGIKYKQVDFATYFNNYWQTGESEHGSSNPSDIYHQMPFLTIAKELLMLFKANKIERLIFLSACDERKIEVFKQTFLKLDKNAVDDKQRGKIINKISLRLLSIETQYSTKADWIKKNCPNFDIFIDDNPYICKEVLNEFISFGLCRDCRKEKQKDCKSCSKEYSTVCSPHYSAIESQHDERVFLIKNEVSELKKEDFL